MVPMPRIDYMSEDFCLEKAIAIMLEFCPLEKVLKRSIEVAII